MANRLVRFGLYLHGGCLLMMLVTLFAGVSLNLFDHLDLAVSIVVLVILIAVVFGFALVLYLIDSISAVFKKCTALSVAKMVVLLLGVPLTVVFPFHSKIVAIVWCFYLILVFLMQIRQRHCS